MSGQTFPAGGRPTGTQLTNIQYQNEEGVSNQAVTSGTDTTTSASYANLAGTGSVTSFTFNKVLASTRVIVRVEAGWQSITNTANTRFGVNVAGTDYDCAQGLAQTGQNLLQAGFAIISGLAAGAYTVQGRWRRVGGAGTPTRTTNEWLAISAAEIT